MLRLCLGLESSVLGRGTFDSPDESIPAPRQRLNKSRIVSRIPQRLANFVYRGIQSMFKIDEGIGRPKTLSQFLPRNQLARSRKQRGKNLKRFFLKFQAMPLPAQFSAAQVGFVFREANY